MNTLADKLSAALAAGTFVRLVVTPAPGADDLQKIIARLIDLKTGPHLSLTHRYPTRDVVKNIPVAAAASWLASLQLQSALLNTTTDDWQLNAGKLIRHKPAITTAPARTHDQTAKAVLDATANDWLHGLGITDGAGKVRASMADKYRQINRYLEIYRHLASNLSIATIADMGCGKAYLTFGLWHLYARVWKRPVRLLGIEERPELVTATNDLARQLNATGLEFVTGKIAAAELPALDALIALHACDTATDDAIHRGIELGAKLIIVAPCCHKQIRPLLGKPAPLAPALAHGIMAERMAEWVTDSIRALHLEWAGYRTKVIEFVASEHTPKNLMIAGIRDPQREPFADPAAKQRLDEFRHFYGLD